MFPWARHLTIIASVSGSALELLLNVKHVNAVRVDRGQTPADQLVSADRSWTYRNRGGVKSPDTEVDSYDLEMQTLPLGQTRTTLCQLCTGDSQSQLVMIQPGIKPGYVVMPLALRCSALDRRDTSWNQTKVCSDAACTEMQCLRPLWYSLELNQGL
jgi:hypothetical protein